MISKQPFFTKVQLTKSEITIEHNKPILLLGSCFAQNMGEKLNENKFQVTINPFGIIYHPIAVFNSLKRILKIQKYKAEELHQHEDNWLSFDHHSSFSSFNKEACLLKINESIEKAHHQILTTKTIFITLGSSWVYEYNNVGIVANCHKIPNKNFEKRLLSVKEIIADFEDVLDEVKILNLNINFVFTVSPVRHVKDGLYENNLSKSTLHLAINNIVSQNENCYYFPAYELVIDELRDYRFYKDDLVHPTTMAVNYVWQKLLECYCNNTTSQLIEQLSKIKQAVHHKPFNFESATHQKFITKQLAWMDKLTQQYPFLNFENEKQKIKKK